MSGNRSLLILICGAAIVNVDLTLGAFLDSPVCLTGQMLANVPLGPHTASDDTLRGGSGQECDCHDATALHGGDCEDIDPMVTDVRSNTKDVMQKNSQS